MFQSPPIPNQVETAYDNVPYPNFAHSQTHPTHLYTLSKLFGLTPKPVQQSRVLELGSASGGNLIPMACHFPSTQFIGIDLSSIQINQGVEQIKDLKLKNIELRHQSFENFKKNEGEFDYIICHGIYSWVTDETRSQILSICKNNLNSNGVACVSYNSYPGWHIVKGIRDLMIWYTKDIDAPQEKLKKSRHILNLLLNTFADKTLPFQTLYYQEITNILSRMVSMGNYIYHDHFEINNDPFYFYQFMDEVKKHQLNYICDAYLVNGFIDLLPQNLLSELREIEDLTAVNQIVDFIYNQRFHHSIITHQHNQIHRKISPKKIREFYFKYQCETDNPDLTEKDIGKLARVRFHNDACNLEVKNPVAQHFMLLLMQNKDKFIHYETLCQQLALAGPIHDLEELKLFIDNELSLLSMAFAGLIKICSYPATYILEVTQKPLACPLARYLAKKQEYITNRNHTFVKLDSVSKVLLPYLDGQHDLAALMQVAKKCLDLESLTLLDHNNQIITDEKIIAEHLKTVCLKSLAFLAKNATLIA